MFIFCILSFLFNGDIFWIFVMYFANFHCILEVFVLHCPVFPWNFVLYSCIIKKNCCGRPLSESSRLEFLERFSANNFALSDPEDHTSGLLNRGGIADLPLLRTILAICQKSREPSFWEVVDSFVLLAYASLAASRTLLQPFYFIFVRNKKQCCDKTTC